jgi:putative oxidoreductase
MSPELGVKNIIKSIIQIKLVEMKNKLLYTPDSWGLIVLRIVLGLVVFPHGAQKLLGWFGGYGFTGSMNYFTQTVGLPWVVGFIVILLEFFGAIALIIGFATRIVATLYIAIAIGIISTSSIQHGFFMNWFGNQGGEGYEYFLLWIGMAIVLVISGGGKYSVDRLLLTANPGIARIAGRKI